MVGRLMTQLGTSSIEAAVVAEFGRVLRAAIGPDDDFFDHGGTSILAMELVNSLCQDLVRDIAIRALYTNSTPARFARHCAQLPVLDPLGGRADRAGADAAGADGAVLALAYGQEYRITHSSRLDGSFADTLRPVALVQRIEGRLDAAVLAASVRALAGRYDALRVHFERRAGDIVQVVSDAANFRAEIAISADRPVEEAAARRLLAASMRRPFALGSGPLWRFAAARTRAGWVTWLIADHSIVDGAAMEVLSRALWSDYAAECGLPGVAEPGPAEPYAEWVRRNAKRSWERERHYWTATMAGVSPFHHWDDRLPPLPEQPPRAESRSLRVPPLRGALQGSYRADGPALLAVVARTLGQQLHRHLGVDEAVLMIPTTNRGPRGNWSQVANVATELPLRVRVGPPTDSAATIRERLDRALQYGEIPIARLVEFFPSPVPPASADATAAQISGRDHVGIRVNLLRAVQRAAVACPELIVRAADDLLPQEVGWVSGLHLDIVVGEDIELQAVYSPVHFQATVVNTFLDAVAASVRDPYSLTHSPREDHPR